MNILDKLKNFFLGLSKKNQQLYFPVNNTTIKNKNFIKKYAVKLVENIKEPTLEECIDEFINQYIIQEQINPKKRDKVYKAFTRMFCEQEEEIENNYTNQIRLKAFVQKNGYSTTPQISNGRIVFMHIAGKTGIDEKKDHEVEKLYINCERKNIALLTAAIFNQIRDVAGDKLQMKCISEQYLEDAKQTESKNKIKNYQRNDKIVIYAENHAKAEIIAEKINSLRLKNPHLFSTTKTAPLLPKKCGFIGTAKNQIGFHVKTPLGYASGSTYNDFLSDILFQSIVCGFDDNISGTSSGHDLDSEERMSKYASIYNEMILEQKNEIINKSKDIFLQICRENNVNTIYTPVSEKQNEQHEQQWHD